MASRPEAFTYISDAIYGSELLFASDFDQPINIGSEEMVTLNQVVDSLEQIAGIKLTRKYDHTAPQGVRGRNSDNTLIRQELGWAPSVSLLSGLEQTYRWVYDQVLAHA
jgi:GDP-D-mannose 3', 5'-epimerase